MDVQHVRGLAFTVGTRGSDRIVLARSGIGKVSAAMVATLLVDHYAPTAVSRHCWRLLDPALQPGDIVIGTEVGHHDYGNDTTAGFVRGQTRNPSPASAIHSCFPRATRCSRPRAERFPR